jgi:DNA polymerase III delta prime subunit
MVGIYAAMVHNVARVDFTEVSNLTVAEATRVKQFMSVSPMQTLKYALIDLDGSSTAAINDLLKTLEEPPSYARFTLISSSKLPATILTRGHKYRVGLLKTNELEQILLNKGLPAEDAKRFSTFGRVDLAMNAYNDVAAKASAITILQAAASGDYELFCQACKAIDENSARMILVALEESASQSWKLFKPEYLEVFGKRPAAMKILAAWSAISTARPQLAVRAALESVLKG